MSSIVYCVAEFKAKKGKEQELFEALMALEPITYREDGCIQYMVTRQIESSFALGVSKYNIVLLEKFINKEAFEWHNSQSYIKDFFNKYIANDTTSIVEDFNVRLFSDKVF
jgi:quinol monooxygenase YgiN